MTFNHDLPPQNRPSTKRSVVRAIFKILGAGVLLFFLLFMMNKIVKNEVSTLVEQKNISW